MKMEFGRSCLYLSTPDLELGWPALFLLAVAVLSLLTNICICAAIGRAKTSQKGGFNWLVFSIAVCDIIGTLALIPLSITKAYLGAYPGPAWLCDIWLYLVLCMICVVGGHLCMLCIDTCLSIQSSQWFSNLSHCTGVNLLKVSVSWLCSLLAPIGIVTWLYGVKVNSWGGSHTTDQLDYDVVNKSGIDGYNRTLLLAVDHCHWEPMDIVMVTCLCCYLLPLLISVPIYGVTWCRLKGATRGVFVRGVRSSNSDYMVEEALLPGHGSIKQNGHRASDIAQKLTASIKSNSGSRRSKRESSIQHRSSVLDRHPSLRYSIKRQPSAKGETNRSSVHRSRRSSPNPSQSGLHTDHQTLAAKLSWNSAVSDIDHCRSPAFNERNPICHSIADLISTHSTEHSLMAVSRTQQQSASYCNLFVDSNRGYEGPATSDSFSQQEVIIHTNPDQSQQSNNEVMTDEKIQNYEKPSKDLVESKNIACLMTDNTASDQDTKVNSTDESETEIEVIVKSPDQLDKEQNQCDEQQATNKGGTTDITPPIQSLTCPNTDTKDEAHTVSKQDEYPDIETALIHKSISNNIQNSDGDNLKITGSRSGSGSELKLSCDQLDATTSYPQSDNLSINRNLLSASYHYEVLTVTEDNVKDQESSSKKEHHSVGRRSKQSIHDTRYLTITLGVLLLLHFLSCLPFMVLFLSGIWCMWYGTIYLQYFIIISEWLIYTGLVLRPFVYAIFHLNLRRAICDLFTRIT